MTRSATAVMWLSVLFLSLPQSPLGAQADNLQAARYGEKPERSAVLYEGPLVHDQQWVMRRGTTNTQILGVFGGTCSLIPSNVRNVQGWERVRFEAEHQGLGVWKVTHVDTVVGTAVADSGLRYSYTYNLRQSVTGITTDGKPPSPSSARPTATNPGFLEPVPGNIESATLEFNDFFLLRDEATGQLVADANVVGWFHRRIDPSEQPPAFFPFVQDGYIPTRLETLAGQAGCDPL